MATSLEPAVQLDRRRRFSLLFCCCCCFSFCPSRTLDGAAGGGGGRGVGGGVADRRLFSSGRSSTAWMQLRFCFKFLDPIWSFFLQGLVWTQHFSGCVTEPSTGRMWSLCHVQILFWGSIFWFKKFQNKVIIRLKKKLVLCRGFGQPIQPAQIRFRRVLRSRRRRRRRRKGVVSVDVFVVIYFLCHSLIFGAAGALSEIRPAAPPAVGGRQEHFVVPLARSGELCFWFSFY